MQYNPDHGLHADPQIIFIAHGESQGPYLHYFNGAKLYGATGSTALKPSDTMKPRVQEAMRSLEAWGVKFVEPKVPYLAQPPSMFEDRDFPRQDWKHVLSAGML